MREIQISDFCQTQIWAALHTNNSRLTALVAAASTKLCQCGLSLVESKTKFGILSADWPTQNWLGLLLAAESYHICSPHRSLRSPGRKNGLLESKYVTLHSTLPVSPATRGGEVATRQIILGSLLIPLSAKYIHNHLFFSQSSRSFLTIYISLTEPLIIARL